MLSRQSRQIIKLLLAFPLFAPHLLAYAISKNKQVINADLARWIEVYPTPVSTPSTMTQLLHLLLNYREFRNLLHYRLGGVGRLLQMWTRQEETLFITTANIGPGLVIHHGFATIITAKSIGAYCWINQQVTIGFASGKGSPTIGNHVTISAGAKVIGGVTVGDHAVIGANAVVTKDVPSHATVVGIPARIVRLNGVRVDQPL